MVSWGLSSFAASFILLHPPFAQSCLCFILQEERDCALQRGCPGWAVDMDFALRMLTCQAGAGAASQSCVEKEEVKLWAKNGQTSCSACPNPSCAIRVNWGLPPLLCH